jgi:hypothetical protein
MIRKGSLVSRVSRRVHKTSSMELQQLRVEVKELRAQIDALRGQFESHTHPVYENSMFGGECVTLETGEPK